MPISPESDHASEFAGEINTKLKPRKRDSRKLINLNFINFLATDNARFQLVKLFFH